MFNSAVLGDKKIFLKKTKGFISNCEGSRQPGCTSQVDQQKTLCIEFLWRWEKSTLRKNTIDDMVGKQVLIHGTLCLSCEHHNSC